MSDLSPNAPIMVNPYPTQDQIAAGLRQAVLILSGVATTLGAARVAGELNTFLTIVGPMAAIISFALGQMHTRSAAKKLAITAAAAPNSVAQVKLS